LEIFEDNENIRITLERDNTESTEEALVEIYKRLRPGEPPTVESARALLESLFFDPRRYDLAKVGRYKLNRKLSLDVPSNVRNLTREDVVASIARLKMKEMLMILIILVIVVCVLLVNSSRISSESVYLVWRELCGNV